MGGFEGGDEGGYWDDDSIAVLNNKSKKTNTDKAYIQTKDGSYSYENISFVPCKCETFTIQGCDEVSLASNIIYKAYIALCKFTNDSDIEEFFHEYKVLVTAEEGCSHSLAFIYLLKEVCNLVLSTAELQEIQSSLK